jgi:glucokinase
MAPSPCHPAETIGVDLGGTKMLVGVVDGDRQVSFESRGRSAGQTQEELLAGLERELSEAMAARPGVAAVGLGLPCTIDQRRGVAINAVNLPIRDVPIRDLIRERIGLPVFLDNDASVAALAEHLFGAARGVQNAVMVTVGTGIGGGLILGGRVFRGTNGGGSELGHTVVEFDGPRCQGSCPNRGCLEAVASGTALAREGRLAAEREPDSMLGAALAEGREIDGVLVTEVAKAGDETAVEVFHLIGRKLGAGLTSFANIFEPEVIVVGGGVAAGAGELLIGPAREEVLTKALPPMNRVSVVGAELGGESGMIGAAAMARLELEEAG